MRAAFAVAALAAAVAAAAAGLDFPHGVSFDGGGFAWLNASGPGYVVLNAPSAARVTFRFNASSEDPCPAVLKGVRVLDARSGRPLARTLHLDPGSAGDSLGALRVLAPPGTVYSVAVRGAVGDRGAGQPTIWHAADGAPIHAGRFP